MVNVLAAAGGLSGFGTAISGQVLPVIASLFVLLLAITLVRHFMGSNHGAIVATILLACIVAVFVFDPTGAETFLKNTATAIMNAT